MTYKRFRWSQCALWLLGLIIVIEVGLVVAIAVWGPRVYTPNDGTFDGTLFYGEEWYGDSGRRRSVDAKPYRVTIDTSSESAELLIRFGFGNGRICQVVGRIELVSAQGKHLWAHSFQGFTPEIGPELFAMTFVDLDSEGQYEIVYRELESNYWQDEKGMAHVSWVMGPVQVVRLNNDVEQKLHGLTIPIKLKLTGLRLGFALLSPLKQLGLILLLLLVPIAWIVMFRAIRAQDE